MEPYNNRVIRSAKSRSHSSKPYERDTSSKGNRNKNETRENGGFFGAIKSSIERFFTYKVEYDDQSESEAEISDNEVMEERIRPVEPTIQSQPLLPQPQVNLTSNITQSLPSSQSQPQQQLQKPALFQFPQPLQTPSSVPSISQMGSNYDSNLGSIDSIARAIESRKAEISLVEYEYYSKMLKDRLAANERERLTLQSHIADTRSPQLGWSLSKPVPVHTASITPNDVRNTFLKRRDMQTENTFLASPKPLAVSSPLVETTSFSGMSSSLKRTRTNQAKNGLEKSVSSDDEQQPVQLENKPPLKKRIKQVAASETAKRILDTLESMASPLEEARTSKAGIFKEIRSSITKPITEFNPRKIEKSVMPVPKTRPVTAKDPDEMEEVAPPTNSISISFDKKKTSSALVPVQLEKKNDKEEKQPSSKKPQKRKEIFETESAHKQQDTDINFYEETNSIDAEERVLTDEEEEELPRKKSARVKKMTKKDQKKSARVPEYKKKGNDVIDLEDDEQIPVDTKLTKVAAPVISSTNQFSALSEIPDVSFGEDVDTEPEVEKVVFTKKPELPQFKETVKKDKEKSPEPLKKETPIITTFETPSTKTGLTLDTDKKKEDKQFTNFLSSHTDKKHEDKDEGHSSKKRREEDSSTENTTIATATPATSTESTIFKSSLSTPSYSFMNFDAKTTEKKEEKTEDKKKEEAPAFSVPTSFGGGITPSFSSFGSGSVTTATPSTSATTSSFGFTFGATADKEKEQEKPKEITIPTISDFTAEKKEDKSTPFASSAAPVFNFGSTITPTFGSTSVAKPEEKKEDAKPMSTFSFLNATTPAFSVTSTTVAEKKEDPLPKKDTASITSFGTPAAATTSLGFAFGTSTNTSTSTATTVAPSLFGATSSFSSTQSSGFVLGDNSKKEEPKKETPALATAVFGAPKDNISSGSSIFGATSGTAFGQTFGTNNAASSPFGFQTPSLEKSMDQDKGSSLGTFVFGSTTNTTTNVVSPPTSTAPAAPFGFAFNAPSALPAPSTSSSSDFVFGSGAATNAPAPSQDFTFGVTTTPTFGPAAPAPSSFSFGSTSFAPTPAASTTTTGFNFATTTFSAGFSSDTSSNAAPFGTDSTFTSAFGDPNATGSGVFSMGTSDKAGRKKLKGKRGQNKGG